MNVGIYIRVSTYHQKQGDSPEIHEERARMYAKSKEWRVTTVYNLAGVSGKSTKHHPETKRMLKQIASGQIGGIIFSDLSRLARNTEELLYYAKYFDEHNASLISLRDSIDTTSSGGKLLYTVKAAMTSWERDNTIERIMESIETRRAMGKMVGGLSSFGYKIIDAELAIDEEEAPVRKLMYELFLKHKRRTIVAKILNEKGYRTRRNSKWTDTTVTRLLINPDAKGLRRSNYFSKDKQKYPRGRKPQSEWIYAPCPAIVSEELWESVNAIIREQKADNKNARPLNQKIHLFTGRLFCHNGHKMVNVSKTKKYSCIACKIRIPREDLEDIFRTRLEKFVFSQDEVDQYLSSSNKAMIDKKEEIENAQRSIEVIAKKLDRLVDLNISGEIPTKGFKTHYEPLYEQMQQLEENIKFLKLESDKMFEIKNSYSTIIDQSKNLYAKWNNLTRPEKRSIVESVVNKITFDGKSITFDLKQIAPLSSLELGSSGQHNGIA